MDILGLITAIYEGLMVGDIITTEYGIKYANCEEKNPLFKNPKVRRIGLYPIKLAMPLIVDYIARLRPNGNIVGIIANGILSTYFSVIVASNLHQILKKNRKDCELQ